MAEIDEHLDRISNLPDPILSLILSFLPTKQAVASIVLSKRWQGIWTEVPALDLDVINLSNESNSTFVDRVLILNVAPFLHQFKLSCCLTKTIKEFHICSWIMNAIRRDIFEMDLSFDIAYSGRPMLLPAMILVCEKLKVLKLKSWTLPLTPLVHLPSLVALHLDHISFVDESTLEYLLSRLPCLEEVTSCD
ncbi:putative F-box/LRR-repeat protein At4g15060 [Chenopodium quinoa]|uniref:putative F-box/LRR-repeat protein At4g15060 n=1 Tax=Chenopodium quinoa TaxID=63459 RepID=UPI000B791CD1|nr:putative F-box/LRR-repeat protein At4g15060 [Chenopodium quinoa]